MGTMMKRAVVVGAGIGGLCTAIGLRDAGWQVTVLERWPSVVGLGTGIAFWPDTEAALRRLGLGAVLADRAVPLGRMSLFRSDGGRLGQFFNERLQIVHRRDLMDGLLAAAAGTEIRTGVDVSADPEALVGADLVVGADGINSAVRAKIFPDASSAPTYLGFVAWRGTLPYELDPDDYGETLGERMHFGLSRLAPGITNWYAGVPTPEGAKEPFDAVAARFSRWRDPIPQVLEDTDANGVLRHPVQDLQPHLKSYVLDNGALVGDAAHAMSPSLGRGGCEAILDALELVSQVSNTHNITGALQAYDHLRRPATQRTVVRARWALRFSTLRYTAVRNGLLRVATRAIR
jgi:2-polyprenyl-6-methoxyphenol hydroxylase-like FAD-dependent oxidoreductase